MNEKYDALEQALNELSVDQDASALIAANPQLKAEIETAQWAHSLAVTDIPSGAIHRSRTRVLARAMQLRPTTQPRAGIFQRIPRFAYALILTLIFLLSWNGLVIASAQALPGDQLYPAKLTLEKLRLGLALNPETHQEVEAEYQARRAEEVKRLLVLERTEFVQFFGIVEEQWDDFWLIDGIEVRLLPETIILGDILTDMRVEVEGATQPEGWVQASEIHLQSFSFTGTVEQISNTLWTISGREVQITSESQIDQSIEVGDTVIIEVQSDDFGTLTADSIMVYGFGNDRLIATETPQPLTDAATETLELENTDEVDNLEETEEQGEADETEEPDETDEPDESDEPKKTDEPDDTDEPDETDQPDEDEEPDEPEEPEETDEPDEKEEP